MSVKFRTIVIVASSLLLILLAGVWIYFNIHFTASLEYKPAPHEYTREVNLSDISLVDTKNVYFGDLHVHTSWSFDAFIYNVRTTPDDAYLFGKGYRIPHVSGDSIQLNRPLDFMAVTDHAEYMGVLTKMQDNNNPLSKLDIAKRINSQDLKVSKKAFGELGFTIALNWPFKALTDADIIHKTWQKNIKAADDHYQPGTFTTFPAYEWTSSLGVFLARPQYAQNLHRNVIFKGGKVSGSPFSSFHSQNPEDLWLWMDLQRSQGIELLAIPHNANISDGKMYATTKFNGDPIDQSYSETRTRNEPVSEVIQIKGQSMSHPKLSMNDEFADFGLYEYTLGRGTKRHLSATKGSYVREGLKDGLLIENRVGVNPYKFGFIGSSDCHNGASNIEEDNNIGKSGVQDPTTKERLANTPAGSRLRKNLVAGLAGVWATQNTREGIFEALMQKETFATSGPRLQIRFFASYNYHENILDEENWIRQAYDLGVPMGGELMSDQGLTSPTFIVTALKDAEGANLDRIQIIKGWIDAHGTAHEKIYDVAWSENRQGNNSGQLTPVGNTVDLTSGTYTNDIGSPILQGTWKDPDYKSSQSSFYYIRVLEIPTPRWTTYDAVRAGQRLPDNVPSTIQERAWSSPIWLNSK